MLRKSTNEVLIKPKISLRVRLAVSAVILTLFVGVVYLAFNAGMQSGHQQLAQDRDMIEQMTSTIATLRSELNASQEELVIAQRHQQIQEEAYKQISDAYAGAEQKNRYLGSRLDFYRSIISPEDGQTGPAIQALDAIQDGDNISFDVTLVQAIKHKHQVRGNLSIELYDGDQLVDEWPESSPRSINFQYFQKISGVIEAVQLTNNARMRVKLILQQGNSVERWFDLSSGA